MAKERETYAFVGDSPVAEAMDPRDVEIRELQDKLSEALSARDSAEKAQTRLNNDVRELESRIEAYRHDSEQDKDIIVQLETERDNASADRDKWHDRCQAMVWFFKEIGVGR